jgi:hypothetical protein
MPDTAELDLGASPSSGSSGIPGWVMIAGAVAGVVGLLLLLKGQGSGGTTAAGTSINAALGSIQEENMNLLGTTQAGFMQSSQDMASGFSGVNQGLTTGFLNTQQSFGSLGTQVSQGFTNTNGLIGSLDQDITSQIAAFSGQSQTNFANLSALVSSGQATQAQVNASQTALIQSIQQDVTSGLVGQQQANQALASIESQVGGTQSDVDAIGRFLGWQFYQIPNRYTPFIPGQQPGGTTPAGSSVIGSV